MDQLIILLWTGASIVLVFILAISRQWCLDYTRPTWRHKCWCDKIDYSVLPWEPWFAWRPIRTISNRVVWWSTVYRTYGNTYVDHDDWQWYHYGDDFDLLKNGN